MPEQDAYLVAIIGAGPAGLFAARELAAHNVKVVILNRDIKPGGLAEYGIYPDKHTMKEGLRKQFHQVLGNEKITYYGNIKIGEQGDLSIGNLRSLGFQAILVTAGAQGTKSLGLPGEDLPGVYHAKDIFYYYNELPPFNQKKFHFGRRCAVIGAGNVMVDIARFLIRERNVEEIISVVRRGPGEVNFTREAMRHIIANLDTVAFEAEIRRVLPALQAVNQGSDVGRQKVLGAITKGDLKFADTRFRFVFLASPVRMFSENGVLVGMEVEDNTLVMRAGAVKARGTGHKHVLPLDTVIFAIGDKIDDTIGLPSNSNEFFKNPSPRYPVDGLSYEAFDPKANEPIEDVFLGGWARKASEGLVGGARKDGINASKAVWQYLQSKPPTSPNQGAIATKMRDLNKPVVTNDDIKRLEMVEAEEARKLGAEEFRFGTTDEMLRAMGLLVTA